MLTREEIISSFKKVDFPEKIIESTSDVKNIIFYSESTEPKSQKEKDTKNLSQSYVLPWRLVQKNLNEANNTFNRGSNFIPKEQLVDIKIENFKLIYDQYFIPLETGMIYFKNNYGGMNGPYNFGQIQNMYKNKKIDSSFEFRPIDLFVFKDLDNFKFKSIKIINESNWIDSIVYSPLLKYYKSSDDNKEEKKVDNHDLITPKAKVEDKTEDKKEDINTNEINEKKEENNNNENQILKMKVDKEKGNINLKINENKKENNIKSNENKDNQNILMREIKLNNEIGIKEDKVIKEKEIKPKEKESNEKEEKEEIRENKNIIIPDQRLILAKEDSNNDNKEIIIPDQKKVNNNKDNKKEENEEINENEKRDIIIEDQKVIKNVENNNNNLSQRNLGENVDIVNTKSEKKEITDIKEEINNENKEIESQNNIDKPKINFESQKQIIKENIEENDIQPKEEMKEKIDIEKFLNNEENGDNQNEIEIIKVERLKESVLADNNKEEEKENDEEIKKNEVSSRKSSEDIKLITNFIKEDEDKKLPFGKDKLPSQKQIQNLEPNNQEENVSNPEKQANIKEKE